MILQSLVRYYEDLLANGSLTAQGWSKENVSWGLEIGINGNIEQVYFLERQQAFVKKSKFVPQVMSVPERVIRTRKIVPNFLCDNSNYILGVSEKSDFEWSKQCFAACKALHLQILENIPGEPATAICNFFKSWCPAESPTDANLQPYLEKILSGKNIAFLYDGDFVQDDPDIRAAWHHYLNKDECPETTFCLVTGQHGTLARLHPNVKGVYDANPTGAQLISFNKESFCSYGHKQGENAPISTYAAFAYTQALRFLLSDRKHVQHIGDTTVVCWATGAVSAYQDIAAKSIAPVAPSLEEIATVQDALKKLAHGQPANWDGFDLDPNTQFFVLGLSPNSSRLSIRFFWQDSFEVFAKNITQHYNNLSIVRPSFDMIKAPSIYQILQETVNKQSRNPTPLPQLSGDLLRAILYGEGFPYPIALLNSVNSRIFAEQKITPNKAAIIKAFYTRHQSPLFPKEARQMELNKDCNYPPYLLGRLFYVLESLQKDAIHGIKTTIKDRYFNAALTTPITAFPVILRLSQSHLKKLEKGLNIYYSKQITDLLSRLNQTFPVRLSLPEQGAFEIGYYHQMQEHFTKNKEV